MTNPDNVGGLRCPKCHGTLEVLVNKAEPWAASSFAPCPDCHPAAKKDEAMTNPDNMGGLLPCPFCGCAMQISSSRDWHRVVGDHDGDCLLFDADGTIYPATDEGKAEALATWNRRDGELCRAAPAGGECQHEWQPDSDVMNARYCPKCDVTQTLPRKPTKRSAPAGSGEVLEHVDHPECNHCYSKAMDRASEPGSSYMTEVAKQNGFPIYEMDFGDEGKERYIRERDMAALLRKLQQGAE